MSAVIFMVAVIALLAFGLWLDQGGADRIAEWAEFNRKTRKAHRNVTNYCNGIQQTGARYHGALMYNKKGL